MSIYPYLENWMDAVCGDCGEPCEPIFNDGVIIYDGPEGNNLKHSFGETWESDCCGVNMFTVCGSDWEPEIDEGDDR